MIDPRQSDPAHPSRLVLERLAAGELPEPERALHAAHAAACERCRARGAQITDDARDFARDIDIARDVAAIVAASRAPRIRMIVASATAALACVAVVVMLARRPDDVPTERPKGEVSFEVIRRDLHGRVGDVASGDRLRPDEAIRFRVTVHEPGYLTILGIDAARAITPYATTLAVARETPLLVAGSIILDATLGPERIVAVVCDWPVPPAVLIAGARGELTRAGGDPRTIVRASHGCRESSIVIEKVAE
jgi:hypothetical protein